MKSKTKKLLAIGLSLALAAGCTMVLSACDPEEEPPVLTDEPLAGETVADFTQGASERFFSSDGWTNGSVFNTWWSGSNVLYEDGVMQLTIDENPDGSEENNNEYFGGEARSHEWYGYGDFEVRMKPAKKAGTASTFFTCTGDYDTNLEGEKNPWDEIDIEFLGKDTTQVQFNYYVNGQGGHEYMYDLGFDASEEFHNYGFRWTEDYICWFVDGEPVHKVEASEGNPMPAAAGRILMNYWCGTSEAEGWMGAYSDPGDEGPVYEWVKTSGDVYMSDIKEEEGNVPEVPEGTEAQALKFEGAELIADAAEAAETVTFTYENVAGNSFQPASADIAAVAGEHNTFTAKIKNNGTETVQARFDILGANQNAGLQTAAVNISAVKADGTQLRTDLQYGGSFIDLAAGEEAVVFITYNNADAERGAVTTLNVFFDNARNDENTYSGSVTLSEMMFFTNEGAVQPGVPGGSDSSVQINGADIPVQGNDYTVTVGEDNAMHVTYTGIQGASYKNVNITDISAVAKDNNTFTAKVTNNGSETLTLRIDVMANEQVTPNTKACNISATMDGQAVYTDRDWGGSTFEIAAGKTVTVKVVYDASYGPQSLQMMFDSSIYEDTAVHSGDVTVAEMAFSKASAPAPEPVPDPVPEQPGEGETEQPEQPGEGETEQPEQPGEGETEQPEQPGEEPEIVETELDAEELTFNSSIEGLYTVKAGAEANTVNVTYTAVEGGTYENVSASIAALADNSAFSVKVVNNGKAEVTLRLDVLAAGKVCVTSAKVNGEAIALNANEGAVVKIAAKEGAVIEVAYGGEVPADQVLFMIDSCVWNDETVHSGDVTFSEMKLLAEKAEQPGEGETEPEPDTEPVPEVPEGTEAQKLLFNSTAYQSDAAEAAEKVTLTYENVGGSSYAPASADIAAMAKDCNTFAVTVKNNGTETVQARFDLIGANPEGKPEGTNTAATNVSAVTAEGTQLRTDLQYGGSFIDLQAGEEVTVYITFDNSNAVRGAASTLNVFLDSSRGDNGTYSGSVTLSNFLFWQA